MTEFASPTQDQELPAGAEQQGQIRPAGEQVFSETTTPSMRGDSVEERAAAGARKDREISIAGKKAALGLDKPDDSHLPAPTVDADRAKNFIMEMLDDIDSFDVKAYLEKHPEKKDEALELGFLKETE